MKRVRLVVFLALGSFELGFAVPITWELPTMGVSGYAFSGRVAGHFTYDADTNAYSDWLFIMSRFEPTPFASFLNGIMDPTTSVLSSYSGWYDVPGSTVRTWFQTVTIRRSDDAWLQLIFHDELTAPGCFESPPCAGPALTDSGGTAGVSGHVGAYLKLPDYPSYYFASGYGTVASVPEPISAALMATGILGFVALCFRKRARTQVRAHGITDRAP